MSQAEELDQKSLTDLSPQAASRLAHAGQWVAWTEGFGRIVSAGGSRDAVRTEAIAAGVDRPICEWIPPDLEKNLGDGQ